MHPEPLQSLGEGETDRATGRRTEDSGNDPELAVVVDVGDENLILADLDVACLVLPPDLGAGVAMTAAVAGVVGLRRRARTALARLGVPGRL
jgi:hypothetical protein